jgi:hypothetical protein
MESLTATVSLDALSTADFQGDLEQFKRDEN